MNEETRASEPVRVSHFSDLLCVWAYVSDVRIDELRAAFGPRIAVDHRVCQVFGDTETKVDRAWADRGGRNAYAKHVRGVVEQFEHVDIADRCWAEVRPSSSLPAHLDLMAVRILVEREDADSAALARTLCAFRRGFFCDARDISAAGTRRDILDEVGIAPDRVAPLIADGSAHAELWRDLAQARALDVRVSPTLVFNDGRQRLNGNVGYRIIEANVRELLDRPRVGHSWC